MEKIQRFPKLPFPLHMHSLLINNPHQNGTFVPIDKCNWYDAHNHPKSIVYIRVRFWYSTFYGFGQMYNDMIHHYGSIQNIFTALKILCALPVFPSPPPSALTPSYHWSFCSLCSFAFSRFHIVGVTQYIVFSDWFLSLSNMHLQFLHVFSWLDSSFPFSAE